MKFRFLSLYLIIIIILGTFLPLKILKASSSSILVNIAPENPAPGENTTGPGINARGGFDCGCQRQPDSGHFLPAERAGKNPGAGFTGSGV